MNGPAVKTNLIRNKQYPEISMKSGGFEHALRTHNHRQWSMGYVVEGETQVSVGNLKVHLTEGQYLAIPADVLHLCSPYEKNHFEFSVLYLPSELLDTEADSLFNICFTGDCSLSHFRTFSQKFLQANHFDELKEAITLFKAILEKERISPLGIAPGDISLNKDYPGQIESQELSRYQKYYRSRKQFGVGKKNIEMIRKIGLAIEDLERGLAPIDVALNRGFCDQSHFNKTFKLYTGMTPLQYSDLNSPRGVNKADLAK